MKTVRSKRKEAMDLHTTDFSTICNTRPFVTVKNRIEKNICNVN